MLDMQDSSYNRSMENDINYPLSEDFNLADPRKIRSFLRERAIWLLSGISGKKCDLHTVENSVVSGEYRSCDINGKEFFVSQLHTPDNNTIPHAVVRDQDIIDIFVPEVFH